MRMTIERGRLTVRCPSSVRNPRMSHEFFVHVDVLLIDQFSQRSDFADLFEEINFILAVAVDGHTSRIVATVFETLEPCVCQYVIENTGGLPSSKTLITSALRFSTR